MPMGEAFHSWLRLDSLTPRYVGGLEWEMGTNGPYPAQLVSRSNPTMP